MTKEEILAIIGNHSTDVTRALRSLISIVDAMAKGSIPLENQPTMIEGLKGSIGYIKGKADEIKAALGQWPE